MTSTVLLTLDGSDKDARAIPVAAAIAELGNASVRVVRVFDTPVRSLSAIAGPLGVSGAVRDLRASAESDLRHAAGDVNELVHTPTTWELIDDADVAAALLRDVEEHDARFVIMATRAAGAVGRAIQGSVADKLVRESPGPVILVAASRSPSRPKAASVPPGACAARRLRCFTSCDHTSARASACPRVRVRPHPSGRSGRCRWVWEWRTAILSLMTPIRVLMSARRSPRKT